MALPQSSLRRSGRGVLFVHSAPKAVCPHVEWTVGRTLGEPISFRWDEQPVLRGTLRTEFTWQGSPGDGARIASALREAWGEYLRFEVGELPSPGNDGARWMHTPALGVFFAQTDWSGNTVITEDRVRSALELGGHDPSAIHNELRLALGQAWDDELEPFRHASDFAPVVWLHAAV